MVREFLSWWFVQLADFLPERWRRFGAGKIDAVVIAPASPLSEPIESVVGILRRNGRETMLGRFAVGGSGLMEVPRPAGKAVVLRLAESDVLSKTLVLPLAAGNVSLARFSAFEMDRETPFSPEELFWNHRIIRRDRRTGQVWVRLQLLPPEQSWGGCCEQLDQAGLKPRRARDRRGSGRETTCRWTSMTATSASRGASFAAMAKSGSGVLRGSGAFAAAAIPFIRQGRWSWPMSSVQIRG